MIAVDLTGQVAWVTGSSGGIGRAIAITLAQAGATCILAGRDVGKLSELKAEIVDKGYPEPCVMEYDISDMQQIKSAFASFKKLFSRLDILVNNAGILESALLPMLQHEVLRKQYTINAEAAIVHMQWAMRWMQKQGYGSIINISSIMGRFGEKGQVAYSASKAALIGASLSAAKELAHSNIRINVVAPGFINTKMATDIPQENYKQRLASIRMERAGRSEEVADSVLFLASSLSSYVTGQVLGVDGGMVI